MSISPLGLRISLALAAVALLAACAQQGGAMFPSTSVAPQSFALPDATPPKCKDQKDFKDYASLTVTLSTAGGAACIPEFDGFGGSVEYPGADPSIKLTEVSSTSDYDKLPQLGSGTAIFYLQLATSGSTFFGESVSAGGGLTSAKIVAGKPYTAFGEATIGTFVYHFSPCYAIATKGKYGGVIGGMGELLKGQILPAAAKGFVEIYSGKQTTTQC
jgi:predicted small lipoprotein YifL